MIELRCKSCGAKVGEAEISEGRFEWVCYRSSCRRYNVYEIKNVYSLKSLQLEGTLVVRA